MRNKHSALDIMDHFKYSREIMAVLQKKWMTGIDVVKQQIWKNTVNLKECVGYNCSFIIEKGLFVEWMAATGGGELTQYLWKQRRLQVLVSKRDSTLGNTRSLQVASRNNYGIIQTYNYKCFFEITIALK